MLNYNEINNVCLAITRGNTHSPWLVLEALNLLYVTGCRVNEITDIERWSRLRNRDLRLLPLKGNKERVFKREDIPVHFYNSVVEGVNAFVPFNSNRLRYYCKQYVVPYPLMVGKKNLELNIFRHRYIKGLANNGLTRLEITALMGYTNNNTVNNYLDSVIVVG